MAYIYPEMDIYTQYAMRPYVRAPQYIPTAQEDSLTALHRDSSKPRSPQKVVYIARRQNTVAPEIHHVMNRIHK